jgi:hypothetical protein
LSLHFIVIGINVNDCNLISGSYFFFFVVFWYFIYFNFDAWIVLARKFCIGYFHFSKFVTFFYLYLLWLRNWNPFIKFENLGINLHILRWWNRVLIFQQNYSITDRFRTSSFHRRIPRS